MLWESYVCKLLNYLFDGDLQVFEAFGLSDASPESIVESVKLIEVAFRVVHFYLFIALNSQTKF